MKTSQSPLILRGVIRPPVSPSPSHRELWGDIQRAADDSPAAPAGAAA